jgi:hypothetical protein
LNFLDLCKRTARESGTLDADSLTSVVNQAKRARRVVGWVGDAYRDIQMMEPRGWPWLTERFTGKLTVALQSEYSGTAWFPTRFRRFVCDAERKDQGYSPFSCYLAADGIASEYALPEIPWGLYVTRYLHGTQTPDKPQEYALSPDGKLHLGPIPDDVYSISGERVKTNQILALDADVPEMPGHDINATEDGGDSHMIIVWKALIRLGEFDEGAFAVATATRNFRECLEALRGSEVLPPITIASEPIA